MMKTTTTQTFKVWLKSGEVVTIEARSEKHARQAISRGRKVGRYNGRIVRIESEQPQAASTTLLNGGHNASWI